MLTFGQRDPSKTYIDRPGAYAVIMGDLGDTVAVVKTNTGYFLPGGGIEGDESEHDCLRRELMEECGFEIEIGPKIGSAERYFFASDKQDYYRSEGHFYYATQCGVVKPATEADHETVWVSAESASQLLYHEHHNWAVRRAFERHM